MLHTVTTVLSYYLSLHNLYEITRIRNLFTEKGKNTFLVLHWFFIFLSINLFSNLENDENDDSDEEPLCDESSDESNSDEE